MYEEHSTEERLITHPKYPKSNGKIKEDLQLLYRNIQASETDVEGKSGFLFSKGGENSYSK